MIEEPEYKASFRWSIGLHTVVLILMLGWWLLEKILPEREPEPFVFEMVSPPGPPAPDPRIEPETAAPVIVPQRPRPEPRPEPEPEPKPEPEPEPLPEPPKPEPPQQRMSYEDFIREEGPVKPTRTVQSRPRQQVEVQIERDFLDDLNNLMAPSEQREFNQMSAAVQNAVQSYLGRVRGRVLSRWEQPSGVSSGREVVLVFDLGRDGGLTAVRVFKTSGVASLDQSALNAIRAAAPFGPTPTGQPMRNLRLPVRIP